MAILKKSLLNLIDLIKFHVYAKLQVHSIVQAEIINFPKLAGCPACSELKCQSCTAIVVSLEVLSRIENSFAPGRFESYPDPRANSVFLGYIRVGIPQFSTGGTIVYLLDSSIMKCWHNRNLTWLTSVLSQSNLLLLASLSDVDRLIECPENKITANTYWNILRVYNFY